MVSAGRGRRRGWLYNFNADSPYTKFDSTFEEMTALRNIRGLVGYGEFIGNFIDVKLLNFHIIPSQIQPFTPFVPPPKLKPHYKTYLDDIGKLKRTFDSYLL